jgi:hypothetical protein
MHYIPTRREAREAANAELENHAPMFECPDCGEIAVDIGGYCHACQDTTTESETEEL